MSNGQNEQAARFRTAWDQWEMLFVLGLNFNQVTVLRQLKEIRQQALPDFRLLQCSSFVLYGTRTVCTKQELKLCARFFEIYPTVLQTPRKY